MLYCLRQETEYGADDQTVNRGGAVAEQLDLVIKNGTFVLGGGSYKMAVGIKDGKVAALG